jgi:hypothetical protein
MSTFHMAWALLTEAMFCWAFILKANNLQNVYMATLFVSFGAKSLFGGGMLVHDISGNPNHTNFLLQTYTSSTICIF